MTVLFDKKKNPPEAQLSWGSDSQGRAQWEALWPKDENGEKEQAVFVGYVPDFNNEADFAVNMLTAYGIPAFKSYNNEGSLGKLMLGTSAYSASLYVPASMAEDAKALLETPADEETMAAAESQADEP